MSYSSTVPSVKCFISPPNIWTSIVTIFACCAQRGDLSLIQDLFVLNRQDPGGRHDAAVAGGTFLGRGAVSHRSGRQHHSSCTMIHSSTHRWITESNCIE